jgi:membrane-associated phospholipid phosphatase
VDTPLATAGGSILLFGTIVACAAIIVAIAVWASSRMGALGKRVQLRPRAAWGRVAAPIGVAVGALAAGFLVTLLLGWGLGLLTKWTQVESFHSTSAQWIAKNRVDSLDWAVSRITMIGGQPFTFGLALIAGLIFSLVHRDPLPMLVAVVAVAGMWELKLLIAHLVDGPPPPQSLTIGEPAPYPSGGAIRLAVAGGFTAWMLTRLRPGRRALWWGLFALALFLEMATRVYLNRHWILDVVFGAVIGLAWLAVLITDVWALDRARRSSRNQPSSTQAEPRALPEGVG